MRKTGTVVDIDGEYVIAAIKRQSACGENCVSCGACRRGTENVRALNAANAKKGDTVEIEMSEKQVLNAAFFVYIIPLLMFALGYCLPAVIVKNNTFCIISAFVFMIIGFFLLRIYDRKTSGRYTPTAVSASGGKNAGKENE